ncbi:AraC family transcriptional regulator [Flavobacterium sp. UBA7682]|uniref:AraC family transcriptional regulator n=1 Tax=Flavobacterium sp. UBA7682 TaxID=1946560 RepID=UPI0025C57517|nr:AraC family transcriptional regulator [Flavobacterium sp. UBA7682]
MSQKKLVLILTLLVHFANAQVENSRANNLLRQISSGALLNTSDTLKSIATAKDLLVKIKSEKNYREMALTYKALMYLSDKKTHLLYSDSILTAANHTKDDILIASAYMTRATVYYGQKDNKNALDNFLLADEYISKTDDSYSIYKIKFGIAQTKYYLGFYDEAISLFRECIDYFKEENDRAYLNSIHGLGVCYNKVGKYDLSSATNQLGINEGRKLENLDMESYFIHSEGINQYFKNNYSKAIKDLNSTIPSMQSKKDFANETVAYFYLGKCFWSLKEQEKAIEYFKKVDKAFEQQKYIRPDLRESYELLIDYYKNHRDTKSQLYYINQLLKVDHILGHNYKYLLRKIVKEYDTKELLKSKQEIENAMTFRTVVGFSIITLMALVIVYLVYRHFKNKRLFEEVMKRDTTQPKTLNNNIEYLVSEVSTKQEMINPQIQETNNKQTSQEISPDIEVGILKKLDKLEASKKYLEKDMTLVKMASLLNTNTKYVTKVIAKHRGKGTIEYITDLKIDYIIDILKKESKYRNYTNKALGEEAGFGSTQNFTRAFKVRTGITPTYFIYKLKKSITAANSQ